jgi:hypothetical protein
MQKQRFEMKYLISEATALKVRDFVRCYIGMDEYSVGRPNYSYPVHSLYIDSDGLHTYWATINGDKNRFKLRIRYYGTGAGAPAFFEIKRRVNSCIMKQRGAVHQDAIRVLLAGQFPEPGHLISRKEAHLVAVQRFCDLMCRLHAVPKVHINYFREAYVSDDDTVRVTLDRDVCGEPNLEPELKVTMDNPARSFGSHVILELKFTNRFPNWFGELVRIFNVMQCGAAKYVESIQAIGSHRLRATGPVVEEEPKYARLD